MTSFASGGVVPRSCGATRPPINDAGWECNGVGLIVVTTINGGKLPVVLPRRALEIVEPELWWDLPVRDFTGGDHAHLYVPRRPTGFRGDTLILWGYTAVPMRKLGTTVDDGVVFIGPPDRKGTP